MKPRTWFMLRTHHRLSILEGSSLVSYQNFRINQHVLEICFCHAWLLGALSFRHSVPSPFAHADLCPSSFLKKSSMKKRLNGLAFLGFGFDSNPLATATYHWKRDHWIFGSSLVFCRCQEHMFRKVKLPNGSLEKRMFNSSRIFFTFVKWVTATSPGFDVYFMIVCNCFGKNLGIMTCMLDT